MRIVFLQTLPNSGLVIIFFMESFHKKKNWIHVGSKEAGPRVATIISIVETCRRLSLPLRDYLGSVLSGLADFPSNRAAELTPNAWAARI
jgi:transposase